MTFGVWQITLSACYGVFDGLSQYIIEVQREEGGEVRGW